jgi:hypothetical protein
MDLESTSQMEQIIRERTKLRLAAGSLRDSKNVKVGRTARLLACVFSSRTVDQNPIPTYSTFLMV